MVGQVTPSVRIPDGVPDTQPVEVVRLKREVRSEIDRALRMVVPLIAACVLGLAVAGCYLADIASSARGLLNLAQYRETLR